MSIYFYTILLLFIIVYIFYSVCFAFNMFNKLTSKVPIIHNGSFESIILFKNIILFYQ